MREQCIPFGAGVAYNVFGRYPDDSMSEVYVSVVSLEREKDERYNRTEK